MPKVEVKSECELSFHVLQQLLQTKTLKLCSFYLYLISNKGVSTERAAVLFPKQDTLNNFVHGGALKSLCCNSSK